MAEKKKTVASILAGIQAELKAPKLQYNKFGKYSYRSLEDITEAVKPLLNGSTFTMSDSIEQVGERIYVKATAALSFGGETIMTTAFAREPDSRKGMDASQITGTASSYARKYAANGLFAIDDTKDADTMPPENHKTKKPEPKPELSAAEVADSLLKRIDACKALPELQNVWIKHSLEIKNLPPEWQKTVTDCKNAKKTAIIDSLNPKQAVMMSTQVDQAVE